MNSLVFVCEETRTSRGVSRGHCREGGRRRSTCGERAATAKGAPARNAFLSRASAPSFSLQFPSKTNDQNTMAHVLLSHRASAPPLLASQRRPPPLRARARSVSEDNNSTSSSTTSGIQFSPAFAQMLQQSLARQSQSTAERIGIPGLILDESSYETQGLSHDDKTGFLVWGAGAALASLLWRGAVMRDDSGEAVVRGARVLELGCGTAVASIAAAAAGAQRCVATDLPSRLGAAERNVAANSEPGGPLGGGDSVVRVRVAALDWAEGEAGVARLLADEEEGFDLVLAADATYERNALAPLARTAAALLRRGGRRRRRGGGVEAPPPPPPKVLLVHRPRSREVDAVMTEAFKAEGLALTEDAALAAAHAAAHAAARSSATEDGDGNGDEPLEFYRVVVAASPQPRC